MRGLEESFRNALDPCLTIWYSEATLATYKTSAVLSNASESPAPHDTFVREGETWKIEFDGETCRIPATLIGLDYISVLLREPGRPFSAQALREYGAVAVPMAPGELEELQSDPDTESDDESGPLQTEWSLDPILNKRTRRDYRNELEYLRGQVTDAQRIGDQDQIDKLRKVGEFITAELRKQTMKTGLERRFADQREQARSTVTHAIRAAVAKIEKTAPLTALHHGNNIQTGATLIYTDRSVRWKT